MLSNQFFLILRNFFAVVTLLVKPTGYCQLPKVNPIVLRLNYTKTKPINTPFEPCTVILRKDFGSVFHAVCTNTGFEALTALPENVTRLYFMKNVIPKLEDSRFSNLSDLNYLSLSSNKIKTLKKTAFYGLSKLEILVLKDNFIRVLEEDTFEHCPHLKEIDFSSNFVRSIRSFAVAMSPLVELETVQFVENKLLNEILYTDLFPMNNSGIFHLELSSCLMQNVSEGAFSHLKNLSYLDISINLITEMELAKAFTNISTNLTTLVMDKMSELNKIPTEAFKHLTPSKIQVLQFNKNRLVKIKEGDFPHLPSLLELELTYCDIEIMEMGALDNLTALQVLDLSKNRLIGLGPIFQMRSLKHLDVSDNRDPTELQFEFGIGINMLVNLTELETLRMNNVILGKLHPRSLFGLRKLRTLSLRWCLLDLEKFTFESLQSLEKLDLSGNVFSTLENDTFFGLKNLKQLVITNSRLNLNPKQLHFNHMPNLEILNLRDNQITQMPIQDLIHLKKLELLLVDDNAIVPWQESFTRGRNGSLQSISIRSNTLYSVTKPMLIDFKTLVDLDVSGNPFNCSTCEMYEFGRWLNSTEIGLVNRHYTTCLNPKSMTGEPVVAVTLPAYCVEDDAPMLIAIGVSLSVIVIVFVAIAITGYYTRWYLRYLWFLAKAKTKRKKAIENDNNYLYDAFISYNEKDRPWLQQHLLPKVESGEAKLHLCLHERDFEAGKEIVYNIVESIDSSRKVVLILSNNFLASQWCTWEMNMAQFKLVEDCREALVLVMLENIEKEKMSSTLKYLIRTRTYLEWTENLQGQKLFWERLRYALRKPENQLQKQRFA